MPFSPAPPHHLYPPAYPALLALWSLVSQSFDWLVLRSVLASVLALAVTWRVIRDAWDRRFALLTLAVLAFNPFLIAWAGHVASEPLFMALGIAALAQTRRPDTPGTAAATTVTAIAGALTRSAGVALLPALALTWLRRRR